MMNQGRPGGASRRPAPRGMVSVELAFGIVTATLLTAFLTTLLMLGVAHAMAAESSAQIARQVARGDDAAVEAAKERAPGKARIMHRDGGVEVTVVARTFVIGVGQVPVSATSWAAYEPGVGP